MKKVLVLGIAIAVVFSVAGIAVAANVPDNYGYIYKAAFNNADDFPDCGKNICKKEIVHYGRSPVKVKPPKNPTCYKLMGVKWASLPVSYVINPANDNGMNYDFVTSTVSAGAEEWDSHTGSEVFADGYVVDYTAEAGIQNYKNEISWGDYPESGVIAVTSIWYIPRFKRIVEFDIIMDNDWAWGDGSADSTKMDVQNIITHEFGHGIGLSDIYDSACSDVTMYGYSWEGDIQKRDLASPDITGLQKLYGA